MIWLMSIEEVNRYETYKTKTTPVCEVDSVLLTDDIIFVNDYYDNLESVFLLMNILEVENTPTRDERE